MKYLFLLLISLVSLSCSYERTTSLPTAPSPPPVNYTVSGTVRDSAGRPLENALVSYVVTTRGSPLWRTDAAGRYEIRLPAGEYMFRITGPTGFRQLLVPVRVEGDTTADFALSAEDGP
jgi:hypothetical protein